MSGKKVAPIAKVGGEPFCAIAFSTTGSLPSLMNHPLCGTAGSLQFPKMLLAVNSRRTRTAGPRASKREGDDSVGTTKLYCVFIQPADDDGLMDEGEERKRGRRIGNRGMAWDRPEAL